MFIEYIPPIATTEDVGKFKVDGTTLEVDENGMLKTYSIPYEAILDDNTWEQISAASEAGVAADLWSVGDCKKITLNGTVGTLNLSNYDTYVYILGFDHNSSIEGTGISFGGFKTALSGGTDVCLISNYASSTTDGTKNFNMEHWGYNNYGGWKGCDLRYDILGSTDSAPSGYGSQAQSGRTGYDASSTTAISPVSNTLMAALPQDLRSVMKPITKYSDNVAGGSGSIQSNVTSSIDYLPLLAEYEVQGSTTYYANPYESSYQTQYTYYANGNSKVKYQHPSTGSTANWRCRSADCGTSYGFCYVDAYGYAGSNSSRYSLGLSPIFLV